MRRHDLRCAGRTGEGATTDTETMLELLDEYEAGNFGYTERVSRSASLPASE